MKLSEQQKQRILSGNALELFGAPLTRRLADAGA
jgi:hypothetical protein